jgi:hypothetical protein
MIVQDRGEGAIAFGLEEFSCEGGGLILEVDDFGFCGVLRRMDRASKKQAYQARDEKPAF